MLTVDAHCHAARDWFEPVEVLLFQMDRNDVEKAVVVQPRWNNDNSYLVECLRRFPGRFAAVGNVDHLAADLHPRLTALVDQGIRGIRFALRDRVSDESTHSLFEALQDLDLSVSIFASYEEYASTYFSGIVSQFPRVKILIEHLSYVTLENPLSHESFAAVLQLARHPNVYMKMHGFGEVLPRPAPSRSPPFLLADSPDFFDRAVAAFGADRVMIATDSPACSFREGYANVLNGLRAYCSTRPAEEQELLLGGTASSLFFT